MKILAVLCQNPFSYSDGGTYAVRSSLRELARTGHLFVTGFGLDFSAAQVGPYISLGSLGVAASSSAGFLRALTSRRSYSVEKYASRFARAAFREILAKDSFDVIWYDKLLAAAVALRSGVLTSSNRSAMHVLRAHNIEHQVFRGRFQTGPGLKRIMLSIENMRLASFEREVLSQVSFTFTISTEDRDQIVRSMPELADRVHFLPIAPEGGSFETRTTRRDRHTVLFVGDCRWRPNYLAAKWIAQELVPGLRRSHPHLTIRMVGKGTEAFNALHENLQGAGFVCDIHGEYDAALCTLAPIWHGGGVNIKVVESLVHGVPVVGSNFGRRGIITPGYLHCETTPEFVSKIAQLADDPLTAQELGKAAQIGMKGMHQHFEELWNKYIDRGAK
jgi:Glycosyl transferases group 1